jgi:hypothetical protein
MAGAGVAGRHSSRSGQHNSEAGSVRERAHQENPKCYEAGAAVMYVSDGL